ncbi:hypothetical protein [Achromobacter xylosoxidans]|uniref:hypothetical protein n=1 Tax=Alcaligenes xylosoxydans xylosoxydans TaxID=85698 RepID=UPI003D079CCF
MIPWKHQAVANNAAGHQFAIETAEMENGVLLRIRFVDSGPIREDSDHLYSSVNEAISAAHRLAGE